MKLLFINHAYPHEAFDLIYADSGGLLQIPDNVLQWSIVDGFEKNGVDFTLASIPALPAWPKYKHFFAPGGTMTFKGKVCGHYLSYCDAPFIKQLSERKVLHRYLKQWCENNRKEDKLYVLVYTQWSHHLKAALEIKKEYPQLVVGCIITDLIESAMEYAANRSFLKRIQLKLEYKAGKQMFPQVDKFILLTKQMEECIPEAINRNIVMEGIAVCEGNSLPNVRADIDEERILLYTGVLEEYAGVNQMVDAFAETTNTSFRLIICGRGSGAEYVQRKSLHDKRIIYKGQVDHAEIYCLQQKARVLINPRRPNGGITKYSFPSKTMEYMASGTPMIGYKLEGIPKEYFDYMYVPEGLDTKSMTDCMNCILTKTDKELAEKGYQACDFVRKNKNPLVQVKRILDFLND